MRRMLVTLTLAAVLGLAACGYDSNGTPGNDQAAAAGATASTATPGGAGGSAPVVAVGQTNLGQVQTDGTGLTLYGLTDDTDGVSTCNGGCAEAWPPVLVTGPDLPAGLDPSVYSVVPRDDGTFQLRAGVFPLYRFAGDEAPGDTNGQGSGGVWFAAAPDGSLIGGGSGSAPAPQPEPEPAPEPAPEPEQPDEDTGYGDDGYGDTGYLESGSSLDDDLGRASYETKVVSGF